MRYYLINPSKKKDIGSTYECCVSFTNPSLNRDYDKQWGYFLKTAKASELYTDKEHKGSFSVSPVLGKCNIVKKNKHCRECPGKLNHIVCNGGVKKIQLHPMCPLDLIYVQV
jgi:hypothetical protein